MAASKTWLWAPLGGEIVGSIVFDGEDLDGILALMRWLITGAAVQGAGVGRKLLAAALGFEPPRVCRRPST